MTYKEFCRQLGKAGLSIREFAELIKMNHNSITNCAKKGEVPSHLAVISALLGEMGEQKIDFRAVLFDIEIAPKKPRGGAAKGRFGGSKQTILDLFAPEPKEVVSE
ncbi:XRE family transcriptional regulator [Pollutimonas sp. M17]|uniref:XRE family transcriptional regulator n=1 Tax=Pollutimonas sp. M17 TaxID=2962065 RepID=UPI0021F477F7|nr:XRE family transcriptional regulator [Pollutimonas sp. M17]UYO92962.1 XRE family transcriptional regulator [Pollutimonas sp. M17]